MFLCKLPINIVCRYIGYIANDILSSGASVKGLSKAPILHFGRTFKPFNSLAEYCIR